MLQIDKYYAQASEELLEMGYLVDQLLGGTYTCLKHKSKEMSDANAKCAQDFYMKEEHLQNTCYSIMIRQQPVASDFRELLALLQISSSLKRIVDYTQDMNEIIFDMSNSNVNPFKDEFKELHTNTSNMVIESLSAFHLKDTVLANNVITKDDVVDFTFEELKVKIISYIEAKEIQGEGVLDYFMLAKYYERIGDRAVTISNSAIYAIG